MKPCSICIQVRDQSRVTVPRHVVHPDLGKPLLYDVRGLAICPDCGGVWHATRFNTFELLGCVRLSEKAARAAG